MEKGEKSGKATESVFRGGWPRQVGSGNKGKIQGISAPNSPASQGWVGTDLICRAGGLLQASRV